MWRFYIPAIFWGVIILILTLTPGQFLPKVDYWSIHSLDKYIHFIIFFIQVFLLFWGYKKQNEIINFKVITFLLTLGIFFGLVIELIQILIPHRSCDINDLLANTIGCFLGASFFFLIIKIQSQKKINNIG